ncbi:MAG TPA: MarR family transcriptional regulator [Solirubrobacteraceae bacterium]|nr:MarR family transcriptional regulator [Solirubrobacteraceae bacterium]
MSVIEEFKGLEDRVARRMAELRPLVDEYHELERIAERIGLSQIPAKGASASARGRARRARGNASATPARPSRRTRNGGRRDQLLAVVKEQPGITVREVGTKLGVDPTSLYRIVHQLEKDGALRKNGRELMPA